MHPGASIDFHHYRIGTGEIIVTGPITAQPAHPQELPNNPAQAALDPASEAERILDVGVRWGPITDDYEARLEAFAEAMQNGDATFRQELMGEILSRDKGALNSWLSVDIIDNETDGGRISGVQRSIIGEALAGAYNDGHPAFENSPIRTADGTELEVNALDGFVLQYSDSGGGDPLEAADRVSAFIDLINSSQGPEARQFREDYSGHLIEQFVLNENVDASRRQVAAGIAAQLLTGDTVHNPDLAGTLQNQTAIGVLDGLRESGDLDTFLDQVALSQNRLGTASLEGLANGNPNYDVRDIAMSDGLSQLMRAVAGNTSPEAAALAVEIASSPSAHGDWFETNGRYSREVVDERTLALSSTFASHSEQVLDALTVYDRSGAGDPDNPNRQQYNVNVDTLGSLFDVILYNPDAPLPGVVQSRVEAYARDLTDGLNSVGNEELPAGSPFAGEDSEDLIGRLAVLSAGTSDAITNQWEAIKSDQEARAAAIGFVVDTILAVIPVGDLVNGQVKGALVDLLPEGALRTAIENFSGQLINEGTGRLTAEAKEQLAEALGPDAANALEQSSLQDALEEGLVAGIEDNDRRTDVIERADRLTGDS